MQSVTATLYSAIANTVHIIYVREIRVEEMQGGL